MQDKVPVMLSQRRVTFLLCWVNAELHSYYAEPTQSQILLPLRKVGMNKTLYIWSGMRKNWKKWIYLTQGSVCIDFRLIDEKTCLCSVYIACPPVMCQCSLWNYSNLKIFPDQLMYSFASTFFIYFLFLLTYILGLCIIQEFWYKNPQPLL